MTSLATPDTDEHKTHAVQHVVQQAPHGATGEPKWSDNLPGLFALIETDRYGMASLVPRSKSLVESASFAAHVNARAESAVNYWNGFKDFEKGSSNIQIIDFLKAHHDFVAIKSSLDDNAAKMLYNKLYQRFFMESAPYEDARHAEFDGNIMLLMSKCIRIKRQCVNMDEKIQKQNDVIVALSAKNFKNRQKLSAQQKLQRLNTAKLDIMMRLSNECQHPIDLAFRGINTDMVFPPVTGSDDPDDAYAFFPWWICPKPWEQPCSNPDQLTELNRRWSEDLGAIKRQWERFLGDPASKEPEEWFATWKTQALSTVALYDHDTSRLNFPFYGPAKQLRNEYANQWTQDRDTIDVWWNAIRSKCHKDLFPAHGPRLKEFDGIFYGQQSAHAQYENSMIADYSQPLLRHKTSHYHHNHMAHEYSGYANDYSRDVIPYQYDGYTHIESEASVLGIVMLFVIGFIVCFIWWMLCAVTGYHLVTKETKKKQDVENQLEFVAN